MMPITALWDVTSGAPIRLQAGEIELERNLEEWIDRDPRLLPGELVILARQLRIDAGKLDLLAIDQQGTLHVVEIKRGLLTRDTVAQGLDYAACITHMDAEELTRRINEHCTERHGKPLSEFLSERHVPSALDASERQVAIMVVGVGRDPGLERVVNYLGQWELDITVVSFEAFRDAEGRQIISREISAEDSPRPRRDSHTGASLTELKQRADEAGIGTVFETIVEAGVGTQLHYRAYKNSVMFAPPNMKFRALFTVWVQPKDGMARVWVGNKVFEDFFPNVTAEKAAAMLGPEGWHAMNDSRARQFAAGLKQLLAQGAATDQP